MFLGRYPAQEKAVAAATVRALFFSTERRQTAKELAEGQGNMAEGYGGIKMKVKDYPEATYRAMDAIVRRKVEDLTLCMEGCQSPIEQLMALALHEEFSSLHTIYEEIRVGVKIIEIRNQDPVLVQSGKTYIPDFSIPVIDVTKQGFSGKMFAIECDGHDFHEKTKEQSTHDRKRERELIAEGYTVIRFSGSEIYQDPSKCASEVFDIIFKYFRQNRRA